MYSNAQRSRATSTTKQDKQEKTTRKGHSIAAITMTADMHNSEPNRNALTMREERIISYILCIHSGVGADAGSMLRSLFDGELCIYFTSIFSEFKLSGRSFFRLSLSLWFRWSSFLAGYFGYFSILRTHIAHSTVHHQIVAQTRRHIAHEVYMLRQA